MTVFILQCWRDLLRNTGRGVLVGLVMSFSVAMMIVFIGVGDGGHAQMIRSATDSFLGHVQVQEPGYADEPDLEHLLAPADIDRVSAVLEDDEDVAGFAPRLAVGALLTKKVSGPGDSEAWVAAAGEGAFLVGVDPALEAGVSTLAGSLVKDDPIGRCTRGCAAALAEIRSTTGRCKEVCQGLQGSLDTHDCSRIAALVCKGGCDPSDDECDEGACVERFRDYCPPPAFLGPRDPFPGSPYKGLVVLGAGLAEALDVGVGDTVAATTVTAKGRAFGCLYRVAGIVKTGSLDINRRFAITHIRKLSEGLDVPGEAGFVVVSLRDPDDADEVAARLEKRLDEDSPSLRALSWREMAPELDVFVKIDQGSLLFMLGLLVSIVGVIVANVVTMSTMERTREYGVRLALGESPARIAAGLVTEIGMLAVISSVLGTVVGEALNLYFMEYGIDLGMGNVETAGVILDTVYHTEFTVYGILFSVGTVIAFSMIGALFPAFRLRRLEPVEALRFV